MESGGGSVPVEISANGQQFSSYRLPFVYLPTARPDLVSPDSGPAAGGTNVTITGAHFGHGEAYRCRFGSVDVVATAADGQTIVCTTPPLPANERKQYRWNANPWDVADGDDGMDEAEPGAWLLPYWLARYHGLVSPEE